MQQHFDSQRFRQALGCFPTGVTIVTARDSAGRDVGITANSFNSVSLTPPLVLWSLGRASTLFDAFMAASHFVIHILSANQDALARQFSLRSADRFIDLSLARGTAGVALLGGCAARFECRSAARYEGGDHIIFLGEVLKFEHLELEPLLFKHGRFALAVEKPAPGR